MFSQVISQKNKKKQRKKPFELGFFGANLAFENVVLAQSFSISAILYAR